MSPSHPGPAYLCPPGLSRHARSESFQALPPRCALPPWSTRRAQSRAHYTPDLGLVIYHKDRSGIHCSPALPRTTGKVNEKTEPCPSWLVTLIEPPCPSTMALAMGNPMPVPWTRYL